MVVARGLENAIWGCMFGARSPGARSPEVLEPGAQEPRSQEPRSQEARSPGERTAMAALAKERKVLSDVSQAAKSKRDNPMEDA